MLENRNLIEIQAVDYLNITKRAALIMLLWLRLRLRLGLGLVARNFPYISREG